MDGTNPKVIEKITKKKTDWTERINNDVEIGPMNEEKQIVIERYEKVLDILKGVPISYEDLVHIKKPLDDLESYLKYIPNGPLFNDVFPTEMKANILSYLCDCSAFIAASVCQEWKTISHDRFKEKEVVIGEEWSRCEDKGCMKPDGHDMIKAAATHKFDVHLVICQPVTEIDRQLVTDALKSVSKFTVVNDYDDGDLEVPILSVEQYEHFFESIEKGDKIIEEVKLVQLNLQDVNQEKLANFLVNKIKRLTLDDVVLDVETFMTKLQQDSINLKLTHLTLRDFEFLFYNLDTYGLPIAFNAADGLCNVENVKLCGSTFVFLESEVIERLVENMLQMPVMIKTLIIIGIENSHECPDFGLLINPQDLKTLFSKMATLQLEGIFTFEQLEAIRSLPDVEVSRVQFNRFNRFFHSVKKGSSGIV